MFSKPTLPSVNESELKKFKRLYKLPESHTIFKSKRNPLESDPRVVQWVQQAFEYSLMDEKRYRKISAVTLFNSYFYPFCEDIDRYENLIKIYQTLFILDDHTECEWADPAKRAENAKQIWDQAILGVDKVADPYKPISMRGWKPYTLYWYSVLNDICLSLNRVSKRRLLKQMKKYCKGNITESEKIESGVKNIKDMEEFLEIRRQTVAMYPVTALVEYADNISLTDEEWDDPLFQELLQVYIDAIIYNNDIISFETEWNEQSRQLDRMFNSVAFTAIKQNICIEEALKKITSLSLQYEKKTMEVMNKLLNTDLSENVKIFLDRIEHIIGGNFQVGQRLDRYNKIYE